MVSMPKPERPTILRGWLVTTLGERRVGDALNLEVDLLARYVARLLEFRPGVGPSIAGSAPAGVTRETLARAGYLAVTGAAAPDPDDRAEGSGS